MTERRIPLEGIDNFRDFGGYPAASGGKLRSGRYFRSAHHASATESDLEKLASLGLAVVFDLRKAEERQGQPNRRWPGFNARIIANEIASEVREWGETIRQPSDVTAESWERGLIAWYQTAPYEERHVDLFRQYFQILAETKEAIVVHCAAGKDRTGLICALTHHLAGVSEDDIFADYLLTNEERRITRRKAELTRQFQERMGFVPSEATLTSIAIAIPDYLHSAFRSIRDRNGSVDLYLSQVLGVDAALRERILARVIV